MKLYGYCPRKFKARDKTIVQAWRNLTRTHQIPADRQFWTLCGPMADRDGTLQPGCELNHCLESGLLSDPAQFCGVEREAEIHAANLDAVQAMKPRPRLFQGEFHAVIDAALERGEFRPAIVNLDTLFMPSRGARLLGETLRVLNRVGGPVMVVLNVVIKNRYVNHSLNDLTEALLADPYCARHLAMGWRDSEVGLTYGGTGKSGTKMGTTILFQPYLEPALAG